MDPRRIWIPASVAALVAVAVYANTLGHGFVIDDVAQVRENPWLSGPERLPEIFGQGVWDFEGRASSYYRPMMYAIYLGTAKIAGRAPLAFHLVNVLFHALASALAAAAAAGLARSLSPGEEAGRSIPWVVGIGFAVHPIHVEAVAWVAGMADLGFGVCALAALCAWLASDGRLRFDVAGAVAYLGAMLFKEPAVLLPAVILLLELLRGTGARRVAIRIAPFAAALAVYLALRVNALGGLAPTATDLGLDASSALRASLVLAGRYVVALVWPFPQNFWHAFRIPASWSSAEVVLAAGALAAFAALVAASRRNRLAFWGLLAVVPPLLPALALRGLNQGLENAFAERYLYMPSFGFLVAVAALASRTGRARRALAALGIVLAFGAGGAAALRNRVWSDHVRLWSDAVGKSPESGMAHQGLGFALLAAGRGEEAAAHLRRAVELRPDLPALARDKANHYERNGLPRKAMFSYLAALKLDSSDARARWGLARQYASLGWNPQAEAEYRRVLEADPSLADAWNEWAILLAERGELAQALERFERASALRPENPDFRANTDRTRALLAKSP